MKKISKKISCTLVLLAIFISSFSMGFESSAAGTSSNYEFYVNYSEPSMSGNNGYINVMYQANGGYRLYTYFWILQYVGDNAYSTNESVQMVVKVSANELYIAPVYNLSTGVNITLACYDWNDDLHILGTHYLPAGNGNAPILQESYSGSPIYGYNFQNCIISSSSTLKDVPIPEIYWNNSIDSYWLDQKLNAILGSLGNIDVDTTDTIIRLENIYNQNVATNRKLDNMTALLKQLTNQSASDKEAVDKFGSDSDSQSNKINDLNEQNKTEKLDKDQASESVDEHIDTEAIGMYGMLLSVFTGDSHILQYILIVLAVALVSYVLFGKR